jgi:hypothetical protein
MNKILILWHQWKAKKAWHKVYDIISSKEISLKELSENSLEYKKANDKLCYHLLKIERLRNNE